MQHNYSTDSAPPVHFPEPVYHIMIGSRPTGDAYYTRREAARTVKLYRILFPAARVSVGQSGRR
jgi:hypothetical protein